MTTLNPAKRVSTGAAVVESDEISRLIETLHRTEQRLEELTSGEVDTVTNAAGRTFLLRRTQDQLRLGAAVKQAAILDALPDQIALLDQYGVIASVNGAWRRFAEENTFPYPDSGIGSSYLDVCDRAAARGSLQARRVAEGIRSVLRGTSQTFSLDYPCHSRTDQRWFILTVTPLVSNELEGAIVVHADVSARTRAQASMQKTAALLQAVVNDTPDLVFVKDVDNRYLLCNEAFGRFVGRTVPEVVGRTDRELFSEEEAADGVRSDQDVIRSQTFVTSEKMRTGVAGSRRLHYWKAPYRNDLGETIGVIGVSRDVTEERKLAADFEAERARLVAVQEVAKIGSWSFDVASRRYDWSAQAHVVCGTDPQHFVPTVESVRALIHPDDLAAVLAVTARSLEEPGRMHRVEHRLRNQDGGEKIVEQRINVVFDDEGVPVRALGTCQDITDRRLAERELRESQAMLSMSGRLAHVAAWSVDLPPVDVFWSDALALIHDEPAGFRPTVEQALAYYAPEYIDNIRSAFERCVAEGIPFDVENQIVTARGRRIWVRAIGEAVRDGNGAIVRVQGALQDLTQRKQAEEDLRRMAMRLTDTLESIADGLLTVDRSWRFTYVNGRAETLLRVTRGDLIGNVLWDIFKEAQGNRTELRLREAMSGQRSIAFETVSPRLGGWFSVNCYPTEEGLSIYFRDDTLKREARQRLELLEASVSQLNDTVMITKAVDGPVPSRSIVFVNDAFVRSTGHAREDVLGKSPEILSGPLTDASTYGAMTAAMGRFEPMHAELVSYRNDGSWFWNELDIVPVSFAGEPLSHFVVIGRDITERKRDKEALEEMNADLETRVNVRTAELNLARQQAEQANQAKSSFLAMMSHEIRTPMNGVIGMIDVLEQTRLRSSQVEIVSSVRESAHALLSIVDDVLDFSKIEADQLQIDCAPMDVGAVVEGACDGFSHLATAKGVSLRVFVDPELPPQALGDAARLRQVLINLVGNSIKFSSGLGRPGDVRVRARLVESGTQHASVQIDVADNGIGMDETALSRLFTPFTQADSGTTRRFGGTGLGLSISRRLVEMMGGLIEVRSKPDSGSTFTVRLMLRVAPGLAVPNGNVTGLEELPCLVLGGSDSNAADLVAYLAHAGASAGQAEAAPDVVRWVLNCPRSRGVVVIAHAGEEIDRTLADCRASFDRRPGFRAGFVVVEPGRQHKRLHDAADVRRLTGDALHRSTFLDAVAQAAGLHVAEPERNVSLELDTLPAALDAFDEPARKRTILIAEDNEINQRVLRKQLALLGFAADITATGREALEHLKRYDYGLLLTDLHMPQMDGYELAAEVRRTETAGRRMPIVALTANAVKGEAKRCRDIGMDDYMTKPLQLKDLKAILEKWCPRPPIDSIDVDADAMRVDELAESELLAGGAPVNLNVLASLVGSDPVVIEEMLQAYKRSSARCGAEVRRALGKGDTAAASDAGHTLKSAARSLGAHRLCELCAEIEATAERQSTDGHADLLERFDAEMALVDDFLERARGIRT